MNLERLLFWLSCVCYVCDHFKDPNKARDPLSFCIQYLLQDLNAVKILLRHNRKPDMEGGEGRRAGERSGRLSALQEQLVWSLLSSGLSKELLIQAMGDLERERASAGVERTDRADGESSEEGEMENPPPIFRELDRLPPEEAARQRAAVDQLLQ